MYTRKRQHPFITFFGTATIYWMHDCFEKKKQLETYKLRRTKESFLFVTDLRQNIESNRSNENKKRRKEML